MNNLDELSLDRIENIEDNIEGLKKGQKMEDEFYHLTMKRNDLKTYVRRFQEVATLCPTMVSDSEKMMEAFIRGLPRSIEGNVTASKPQILVEPINIA
uniref:Reverse transcriptase domain-containing protein n=1 Tax=Tanacetum cinerariifolium TaxID=118510 RepID=A0A699GYR5_TANCI|nr:reverse transcriptase domain-containing protein [Tanacetum cinerariifolium]